MGGSRNTFIPFHWVFGEGGGGKREEKKWERERLWEIKHIFFGLLFTACGCMKLLRCYFHNPQIAFLILKR
jgi:hypothetical protein